ncbi:hypothetical protein CRENPOLYSF2_2650003 [Crenothrix polyspora]|uniref:Uncharacterized protein n=1 Tax=Crenothrix polyspora TaxID=360316 RepID=A0A1R4H7U5_9GAMM|nr:hypothetical protein [Crenothrix polyspora]SJM92322.1 hypothetical protein CRENPOLYSF2_2650003 [Crenothrix polyspora]
MQMEILGSFMILDEKEITWEPLPRNVVLTPKQNFLFFSNGFLEAASNNDGFLPITRESISGRMFALKSQPSNYLFYLEEQDNKAFIFSPYSSDILPPGGVSINGAIFAAGFVDAIMYKNKANNPNLTFLYNINIQDNSINSKFGVEPGVPAHDLSD